VKYDQDAKCPMFLRFLDYIMDGDQDMIDYLQRIVGYTLTGEIKEQCIFMLEGAGENGKSTFVETISALMGPYANTANFQTFLIRAKNAHTEDLARLKDARMVTASEIDKGGKLSESIIKSITGGEKVAARFMRKNSFEYKPKYKLFLSFNVKPQISGTDHGTWRRIHLIPFNVQIPKEKRDDDLDQKLLTELSGILNWAIEGCLQWQMIKLAPPEKVRKAVERYRYSQDIVTYFLNEMVVEKENSRIVKDDLYQAFVTFCNDVDEYPINKITFGKRLIQLKIDESKSDSTRYWKDIALKEEITE
jgi:putative DNA primase/helicase